MHFHRLLILILIALVAHAALASPADDSLIALLDSDFQAQMQRDPIEAGRRGDHRYDTLLPDPSPAARTKWLDESRARLEKLNAIDAAALTTANRINAGMLRWELQLRLDGEKFNLWEMPVTQQDGPQNTLPQLPDNLSITTDAERELYLARLEKIPAYLDQTIANMREGLKEKRTPPRIVMASVPDQAAAQADARYLDLPQDHVMYRPLAAGSAEIAARGKRLITSGIVPAFQRLETFLRDEYVPACRETIAAKELPSGMEFYTYQIRRMTTTTLTADQIHQMGLGEVARIRAEMFTVIARSDFSGHAEPPSEALFKSFVAYLRTDPRFYYSSAEELLARYREIAKTIDPEMSRLFKTLPRLSYGVREMPRFIAPSAPTAYYYPGSLDTGLPGYFIANTWRLDQRPKYEMISLTLHEAVPGHHHQISLAQELKRSGMPEWRTTVDYTVFTEGWGLYSERLGLEMGDDPRSSANPDAKGLYADPYDDFGRLSYEMWRAMRLVVDTGMHALGWSREKAIRYMLDNSALTETNIEREVDRYIAWPGQALGYKIGELRIRDLRSKAEEALGDKFNIREFHDAVLMQGSVPLELLEQQVMEWVAAKLKR